MRLWVFDVLTLQIVLLPGYAAAVFSLFLIHYHRRLLLQGVGLRISSDHVAVFSLRLVQQLTSPLLLVLILLCSTLRCREGFFCSGQLYLGCWGVKYATASLCVFATSMFCFGFAPIRTTLPYLAEVTLALTWLCLSFFWVQLITNLIVFIFFLEIFGLLLLTALLYLFVVARRRVGSLVVNFKLLNAAYSNRFLFIQTILFFLWSSALSMLLLFWSSLVVGHHCLSLEFSLVEIFHSVDAPTPRGHASGVVPQRGVLFFFFFAVLLKSSIVPLQAWLITFYRHLPLSALCAYVCFYYLYLLMVVLNLLFGYLYVFIPLWHWGAVCLVGFGAAHALFNIGEAFTLRGFVAYSSIINMFFLLLLLLVAFL